MDLLATKFQPTLATLLAPPRQQHNLFIKISEALEGVLAIKVSVFGGIPIHVTLFFPRVQYFVATAVSIRGIKRRLATELDPRVASFFVSCGDVALKDNNYLGMTIALQFQNEVAPSFVQPWHQLLKSITNKRSVLVDDAKAKAL